MKKIAVLGFGTVGSGVVEILNGTDFTSKIGEDVIVKTIVDIRDFKDSPYADLVTPDFETVINDPEIETVVETIGGLKPAYDFTKRSLLAGKSVVTSNKELVSVHGAELLKIARDKGVCYLFEASVGGGIPIIRPLNNCLLANEIKSIMGILNGTTNYILTKMFKNGETFESALKDAQDKGYAERNPEADVEGIDAVRKIAILSSLAYGKHIDSTKISTEGISKITLKDVKFADSTGRSVKLIGQSKNTPDGVYAKVSPVMLPAGHPLHDVEDVFNAILVDGSATGDVMFYGKGAGKLPTASAVVADVFDIVKHNCKGAPYWEEGGVLCDKNPDKVKYYIRTDASRNDVQAQFGNVGCMADDGEVMFITFEDYEDKINEKINEFAKSHNILGKIQVL